MKEQVPWLTAFRFGIDCVCKYNQYLFPWWIMDNNNNNNNNNNKWDLIEILKFEKMENNNIDVC